MELKDKKKIVKTVGAADIALAKLEESIHAFEAQGKTAPKSDRQLLKSIHRILDILKVNPFAGDPVAHPLWPREYNHFPNLFRIELSQFWRLLYYVAGDEVTIISIVFEIIDHEHYNKIFSYQKR